MNRPNQHRFSPFDNPAETINSDMGFLSGPRTVEGAVKEKRPEADLKLQYRKVLELSLVFTLLILVAVFQLAKQFSLMPSTLSSNEIRIEVADIPPTEQRRDLPPPPARPAVPVPTESEFIPEDVTISSTELDLTELPPPPAPPQGDRYENYQFIAYDEPPQPIGGYAVILKNLKYPAIAQKAGIEAMVVVAVLIDERGNSVKTQILSSTNSMMGFDEAAQKAVMQVKWKPAKQRDKVVKVWVSVPIRFLLKDRPEQVS